MTEPSTSNVHPFDRRLLARMTGALGDSQTIGKTCSDLGQIFSEFLPDIFKNETGLDIAIGYAGFEVGLKSELITDLGTAVALSDTALRNWAPDFNLSCDSPVIITLMETLLGAPLSSIEEPKPRKLSAIELDVATMIFEKFADVLRSAVNAPGGFEPLLGRPYNASDRPAPDPEIEDVYSACINMTVGLGPVLSTFSVIVPQKTLLKTHIVSPHGVGHNKKPNSDWNEHLEQQVRRSAVTLEARIKLESLTLDTISRLQPGDVIPFHDAKDVRVEVNANGRELYICEFGRSGAKYTVRIKDTHGSENDILHHIMG
ncbi:FliM/FliN family flagellar motor switch protein [Pararhizobium antarcticum]|uniref:Flagellar motor switch protein FliM n=1 Tax=Pararhizobium antarcticum TaxID=1798805 RepID=A0A657LT01_9HYPH|nr:FliM/FliN family flagellar motor switch protein [Pararhizobium antarcticum]OJF94275.1 flagellar motor switch protein FliM [Rhizobium sp. 58]OJF96301.1 flagellar motor switch protein FliM [Pararhizobium antarcticum]